MKPVMQLRIGWSLTKIDVPTFGGNAYTTPSSLSKFDPNAEGFGQITVNLTPRIATRPDAGPVTVEEGHRLHQRMGCITCHSTDGIDVANTPCRAMRAW